MSFRIAPSRIGWTFMESDAFVNTLMGPRGEGKTTHGYYRLLHRAKKYLPREVLPLKCVAIRDTLVNLRDSTIKTLHELEGQGLTVEWDHSQGHESGALLGNGLVEMRFLGLDRMAEVNKLQGMGAGVIWLEEPAPAADISGGIPVEVFGVAATSLRQQGVVDAWIQITMNPPDEDHWTLAVGERMLELEHKIRQLMPALGQRPMVRLFRIPKGENAFYSDQRRAENRLALEATGRGDLVARLIEGQVGQIVLGEPVIPEYNDQTHVAPDPLPVLRYGTIVRSWDFGLTPTVSWWQITPSAHVNALWTVQGVNQGVEQLIEEQIKPWESEYLRAFEGTIRDVGDPAGRQREQSNSEHTAVMVIETKLTSAIGQHAPRAIFEDGPIHWPSRRDALKALMNRMSRGRPIVQVDPENKPLRRALRGGWHYPKDALGRITATLMAAKRASGLHDHIGHEACYFASVLFPVEDYYRKPTRPTAASIPARRDLSWMGV